MRTARFAGCLVGVVAWVALAGGASAQDMAAVVAKAREQVDNGNYADAVKTLSALRNRKLPPQLAVEAGLIEATATLVAEGAPAATAACGRAIVAAGYDPDIAREQSPKVREVCRAAAQKVRGGRLAGEGAEVGKLEVRAPEVAYQPVRISATIEKKPAWLRMVARVESSELGDKFDVPLIPSDDGPLLGTLDASWIRPKSRLTLTLVAQDKFGDLGDGLGNSELVVPAAEAAIVLGTAPSDARITLDDEVVKPDAQGQIPAPPGKHDIEMILANGASANASVELARGVVTRVELSPQLSEPSRVWPWIMTGTAVALGVAGGILLVNSELRRSELEDAAAAREPGTGLPATEYAELESIDQERTTFQYIGIGLLSGAGAAAVVATILWLLPADGGEPVAASVEPVVGPGFVGVRGRF